MTRTNYEDREFYYDALQDKAGGRAKIVAETTDRLMGELLKGFINAGLKFPNDDRCFAVEIAVFKTAMEANKA